jgi:hypothetical protein
MLLVSLIYGAIVGFATFWADIEAFFRQLFGA